MNIVIGSTNQAKMTAVKNTFPESDIQALRVPSGVACQPIGDEETLIGAINRAKNVRKKYPQSYAIGLEGGVMYLQEELYLNSWGVIITPTGKQYTAAGARIPLPSEFIQPINKGIELGELMDAYTKKQNIGQREGAIGIFTSAYLTRSDLFTQIMKILKGQLEYDTKHNHLL